MYLVVSFFGLSNTKGKQAAMFMKPLKHIKIFDAGGGVGDFWLNISSNEGIHLFMKVYCLPCCMVILLHGIECHCRVNPKIVVYPIGSMELEYLPQHLPTKISAKCR